MSSSTDIETETSENRKLSTWRPEYPKDLHQNVVGECSSAWSSGKPWTKLRVIGDQDAHIGECAGSQGHHHERCDCRVEAVQYSSAFGEPLWYCEKHALEQAEWDVVHYGV